jgi:hypothetical protein
MQIKKIKSEKMNMTVDEYEEKMVLEKYAEQLKKLGLEL